MIIAKVDGFGDAGFNLLFNYTTGDNTTKANLEMTALVLSVIACMMPEGYILETTPKPNYNKIKIQQIPQRYVAALRFTGR